MTPQQALENIATVLGSASVAFNRQTWQAVEQSLMVLKQAIEPAIPAPAAPATP